MPTGDFPDRVCDPKDDSKFYSTEPVTAEKRERFRDNLGLLKNVTYVFNEDGTVNWRAMVRPEHLFFNNQKAADIAKRFNLDTARVKYAKVAEFDQKLIDDSHVLISLAGIRYLARLRGYETIKSRLVTSTPEFASVETHITWLPNFETDFQYETCPDGADAGLHNTFEFAQRYLTAIAFNRAFVRAVRGYLQIKIVSNEEMGPDTPRPQAGREPEVDAGASMAMTPKTLVEAQYVKLATKYKWKSFKDFTEQLCLGFVDNKKYSFESNPREWNSAADASWNDLNTLMTIFKKHLT